MVQSTTWVDYRVPTTLASDTEESVVGTQWHQVASAHLVDLLSAVARRRREAWGVCMWITLSGLRHTDGTSYDPMPDVMVLRQPLPRMDVAEVHLAEVGPPLFIAELASRSTKHNDLWEKRAVYEAIGVAEYLVFDAVGGFFQAPLLAWRLERGRYVEWRPAADRWWHSAALDVSLRLDDLYLRVRDDRDGAEIPLAEVSREMAAEVIRERDEEARLRAEVIRERDEEARLRAEVIRERDEEARLRAEVIRERDEEARLRAEVIRERDELMRERAALEQRLAQLEQRRLEPER